MIRAAVAAAFCAALCAAAGCITQTVTEREFYEPTEKTAFKREDGLTVGALKKETVRTGSPDWSDSKSFSAVSVGR